MLRGSRGWCIRVPAGSGCARGLGHVRRGSRAPARCPCRGAVGGALSRQDREQAGLLGKVDEKVDIAVRAVLSAGHAPEDPEVAGSRVPDRFEQGLAVLPQPARERCPADRALSGRSDSHPRSARDRWRRRAASTPQPPAAACLLGAGLHESAAPAVYGGQAKAACRTFGQKLWQTPGKCPRGLQDGAATTVRVGSERGRRYPASRGGLDGQDELSA